MPLVRLSGGGCERSKVFNVLGDDRAGLLLGYIEDRRVRSSSKVGTLSDGDNVMATST